MLQKINECEFIAIKTTKGNRVKKIFKKIKKNISELWDNSKLSNICVTGDLEGKKTYLKK